MTYNARHGLTTEELREIAVQHLLADTEHWALIVTEADARAAIDRMYAQEKRLSFDRRDVIDLTEPVEATA